MTAEELKTKLHYAPETGIFTWLKSPGGAIRVGDRAGSKVKVSDRENEYVQICLGGRKYFAHRLAWLYMTGEMPALRVTHLNRIGTDNRWENLAHENAFETALRICPNLPSGGKYPGVRKRGRRFEARIKVRGEYTTVGFFDTPELANYARLDAIKTLRP